MGILVNFQNNSTKLVLRLSFYRWGYRTEAQKKKKKALCRSQAASVVWITAGPLHFIVLISIKSCADAQTMHFVSLNLSFFTCKIVVILLCMIFVKSK